MQDFLRLLGDTGRFIQSLAPGGQKPRQALKNFSRPQEKVTIQPSQGQPKVKPQPKLNINMLQQLAKVGANPMSSAKIYAGGLAAETGAKLAKRGIAQLPKLKGVQQLTSAVPEIGKVGNFVNQALIQPTLDSTARLGQTGQGKQVYKKGVKGAAQLGGDVLNVASLAPGFAAVKGLAQAPTLAKIGKSFGYNALAGAGAGLSQELQGDKINPMNVAIPAIAGGALGVAGGLGVAGTKAIARDLKGGAPILRSTDGFIGGSRATGFAKAEAKGKTFIGTDGKPRFEFSDKKAKVIEKAIPSLQAGQTVPLRDVLYHPELKKNYETFFGDGEGVKVRLDPTINARALFDPNSSTILINPNVIDLRTKLGKETFIHELTHKKQVFEGHATGTTPEAVARAAKSPELRQTEDFINANLERFNVLKSNYKQGLITKQQFEEDPLVDAFRVSLERQKRLVRMEPIDNGFAGYRANAGEQEAELAASRAHMSQRQLNRNPIETMPARVTNSPAMAGSTDLMAAARNTPQPKNPRDGKFVKSTETQSSLHQEAAKYDSAKEFIAKVRGSATQYGDYNPSLRVGGNFPDAKRLSDLGIDPEREVTIYRGIDDPSGKVKRQINDGDFVTADYDSALAYTGSPKDVVSMKVKAKDLYSEDADQFQEYGFYTGAEFVYSSKHKAAPQLSDQQLTDIYNEVKKPVAQSPLSDTPEVVYRGVTEKKQFRFNTLGEGLYTTTSEKGAKGYAGEGGKVLKLSSKEAVPQNPLRFDSMDDFFKWRDANVADLKNINKTVTELGHDGIAVKNGDKTNYVKYEFQPPTPKPSQGGEPGLMASAIEPDRPRTQAQANAEHAEKLKRAGISQDDYAALHDQVEAANRKQSELHRKLGDFMTANVDPKTRKLSDAAQTEARRLHSEWSKALNEWESGVKRQREIDELPSTPSPQPKPSQGGVGKPSQAGLVGQKVRAIDRGNVGTIARVNEDGSFSVHFKNRSDKTSATVRMSESQVEVLGKGVRVAAKPKTVMEAFKELPGARVTDPSKVKNELGDFGREPQTLNANRLDLDNSQRAEILEMTAKEVRKTLSDKEILNIASKGGIDTKSNSIEDTAKKIAGQLNQRRSVVEAENAYTALQKSGASADKVAEAFLETFDKANTAAAQGTDLGRQLAARRIIANELDTPMQRVIKLLNEAGINPEVAAKEAVGVDWNDARSVGAFYRKLVPAKARDWLTLTRYNSMLSSPLTQIVNISSNAANVAIVAPIQKTLVGGLDFLGSKLTGKERKYFAGEGKAFAEGTIKNLAPAWDNLISTMRGVKETTDLDARDIPLATKGLAGAAYKGLSFSLKVLGGMDSFFRTLAKGGETSSLKFRVGKGVKVGGLEQLAEDKAAYAIFQQEIGKAGQGGLLETMDKLATPLLQLRSQKGAAGQIASFVIPFMKTPLNIVKQGVEYSPLGVATMKGSLEPTEQLAKAIMGTAVFGVAATSVASGNVTWAEPTDAKKKAAFREAGLQPYAIKVGNNWVSFQKLPPVLAFPFALVAGLDDAQKNGLMGADQIAKLLEGISNTTNFYADQSFLKSMGDLIAGVKGDYERKSSMVANMGQQVIPFRAFTGWLARLTDPLQRQVDRDGTFWQQQGQQLALQYPGLSQNVPARVGASGNPMPANNKELNAFSPVRITKEEPVYRQSYDAMEQKTRDNRNKIASKKTEKAAKEESKTGVSVLDRYNELDSEGKENFKKDAANVYSLARARYEANKASGKIKPGSPADFKAQQALAKQEITSKYPQDVLDFYALSNTQKSDYFKQDPKGAQKLYDQAKKLEGELGAKKIATKKVKLATAKVGKKGRKKSYRFKLASVRIKKAPLAKLSKPKKTKAPKIKFAKKGGKKVSITA